MSITPFEIPLTPVSQTFTIGLGGVDYRITLIWRNLMGWVIDIADTLGNPIINGIPLVTGANLLDGLEYLGFTSGGLAVQTDHDVNAVPTFTNLGVTSHLYWVATE